MPFTIITGGSFTSDGSAVNLPMPSSPDYMKTTNITQMALSGSVCVAGEWFGSKFGVGASATNSGLRWRKAGTHAILIDSFSTSTASGGFTYVNTAPSIEAQAPNAITAITAASPAVVSQTNTYSDGDIIQFYNTTGMLQISGMNFQISSSSGAGYTLIGLQAAGFATPATAGYTRRISKYAAVDPQFLFITEITKATQAVVRTSVNPANYYVEGMKIRFSIPYSFGMNEMNGLTGKIISIDEANYTMTVDIDSSAFTTFAFPASTSSPTAPLFATLSPSGVSTQFDPVNLVTTGYNFQYQPFRTGQFTPYMHLAGGSNSPAGANNDVIDWIAYKFEN